jgi:AcrR family transcriptional regulator
LAYRETEHTLAKKADTRLRLLKAARRLVQQGGFAAASAASAASASAVAKESGVASGTIYRHFPNKSELVAEVFRYATEREVAAVAQA